MNVSSLIQEYNATRPNQVSDDAKMEWLRRLEEQIIAEIILTHDDDGSGPDLTPLFYDGDNWSVEGTTLYINTDAEAQADRTRNWNMDSDLIVPDAYSDLYLFYIDQQIAYMNADTERYNISAQKFNDAYLTYQKFYNRTHKPLKTRGFLFDHRRL